MPKDIPFHKLSKKAKIQRLNIEDEEKLNSTDSSVEFDESHIQSYISVRSNNSEIPDDHLQKELYQHSKPFHHSELPHHSELVHYSEYFDNFEYSENSENSDFEYTFCIKSTGNR
jgi:hypothetical protein